MITTYNIGGSKLTDIGDDIHVYHEGDDKKAKLIAYNGGSIIVEIEGIKELYDKEIWQVQ